jgi:hypothetical protein
MRSNCDECCFRVRPGQAIALSDSHDSQKSIINGYNFDTTNIISCADMNKAEETLKQIPMHGIIKCAYIDIDDFRMKVLWEGKNDSIIYS